MRRNSGKVSSGGANLRIKSLKVDGKTISASGLAKFYAFVTIAAGVPTLAASFNVSGIVDDGVGILTVTIDTDFASANWCPQVSGGSIASATTTYSFGIEAIAAGSVQVISQRADGTDIDMNRLSICGFGEQ